MRKSIIGVFTDTPSCESEARLLAQQLHLPFTLTIENFQYLLIVTPDFLGLMNPRTKSKPLYVDFLSGKMQYRRQRATLRNETLARALGLKNQSQIRILDATAGLGRDSFILACLGFEVELLERSPIVFALLQDGIKRALLHPDVAPIVKRLHLIQSDAISWMENCSNNPDVIYLDPMFPERQKSALVKKEMQIFQDIIGEDDDSEWLLKTALACAKKRVVVKRPRSAEIIKGPMPSFSIKGSASRFDIYLI